MRLAVGDDVAGVAGAWFEGLGPAHPHAQATRPTDRVALRQASEEVVGLRAVRVWTAGRTPAGVPPRRTGRGPTVEFVSSSGERYEMFVGVLDDVVRPKGRFRRVTVPDLVGHPVSEACHVLGRLGLRIRTRTDVVKPPPIQATVVGQEPKAGTKARRSTLVVLDLDFPAPRG